MRKFSVAFAFVLLLAAPRFCSRREQVAPPETVAQSTATPSPSMPDDPVLEQSAFIRTSPLVSISARPEATIAADTAPTICDVGAIFKGPMPGWQEIVLVHRRVQYVAPIPDPHASSITVIWRRVPCAVLNDKTPDFRRRTSLTFYVGP